MLKSTKMHHRSSIFLSRLQLSIRGRNPPLTYSHARRFPPSLTDSEIDTMTRYRPRDKRRYDLSLATLPTLGCVVRDAWQLMAAPYTTNWMKTNEQKDLLTTAWPKSMMTLIGKSSSPAGHEMKINRTGEIKHLSITKLLRMRSH